jgi:predicted acyltransferase
MPTTSAATTRVLSTRVLSVDVLRGITVAFMILVNDPGDWAHVYRQLDHSAWNGFTCTDLVFPNFLFLVGVSIVLSLESRIQRGESRKTLGLHMLRRAAILFALNMLSVFPSFDFDHLRIYGVLERIALCYLAAGLICLVTLRARTLLTIAGALLAGYWMLMRFVPVPGLGVPTHGFPILDPDRNLAAWLDRAVVAFTQRTLQTGVLYEQTRDPEGLLSTLPAIATTLIGAVAGLWLQGRNTREAGVRLRGLVLAGAGCLAGGLIWSPWFPINKNLWTSSYVLFAAGWSLLLLAAGYWLVDVRRVNQSGLGKWLIWPWLVFGSNAIFAYVFSNLIVETMLWIRVPSGEPTGPATVTAWFWVYRHGFAHGHSTELTSLVFGLAFVAVCLLPSWMLWRNSIFLRI